jgi:hypothetical protein
VVPRKRRLNDVEFVTAWAKAGSPDEVVAATGMSRVGAQARASKLRKAGVKLRRFGRGRRAIDVKGLNDLLGKLGALDEGKAKKGR